jgi:hypothetical protein
MTPRPASWPSLALALGVALVAGMVGACDLSALDTPVPASSTPAPTATPTPSFVRPTPAPLPTFLVYVVAQGDSLTSIAKTFGTKAQSIAYWNRATYPSLDPDSSRYEPNRIKVGWALVLIPNGEVDPEDLPPGASSPAVLNPTPVPNPTPFPSPT